MMAVGFEQPGQERDTRKVKSSTNIDFALISFDIPKGSQFMINGNLKHFQQTSRSILIQYLYRKAIFSLHKFNVKSIQHL